MQIEVSHLVKEYKRKKNPENMLAEAVGYVGPNGCGKSTTIKMLSGVLTPTSGKVLVGGLEPTKNRQKINKKTGIVFGNRSVLWWDVPIIESYKVLQKLYEIPEKRFQENLEEFADIIGIRQLLGVPERQLSLGQKMRCNIAAAFLHDPEIVYLDEPTIGLDSESKLRIREFIRQMNEERHTTFIVTSHDFQDIESLCKRIILINHGEVVVDDGIQKIQKNYQSKKQIRFEMDQNPWMETDQFTMDGVTILDKTPYSLVLECEIQKVDAMAVVDQVVDQVSRACQILDISIQGQDIESIIREIVTERG